MAINKILNIAQHVKMATINKILINWINNAAQLLNFIRNSAEEEKEL